MSGVGLVHGARKLASRVAAERELALARRLGHWYTEEDRQLLREEEARLALARRTEALNQAARVGTVGVLVAAWAIPPLWPVAAVASFRVFPRTSRRVLLTLLGLTGATLVGTGVVVHGVMQSSLSPAPSALPALPPAGQSETP